MALNEKFQEHHENVSEFFSLSGRTLKNKTGFVKGKKKRVNPVTIKTVTAAAAVAVAASVVMAIYVRCIPLEIGKSYADIEVKTINADAGSDVDYYLVKGIDSVDKNNFKRYLNTALIAEKGNLDLTDPTMEFERLLAKTGYQLVFTYIDENGEEQFAGTYSFTTGPVVSPVAEKIKEVVEKVTGHKFEEKDNPRDNPPEESREEPPAPPVSESVPEVIPPVSESVSEVIPPPPPPPPVPSESVPETTQSEPPAPEPSPDPGPGPSPNPPPAQNGVTVDVPEYDFGASNDAGGGYISFNVDFPVNVTGADVQLTSAKVIHTNAAGQSSEESVPVENIRGRANQPMYLPSVSTATLRKGDSEKLEAVVNYTEGGQNKTATQIFEAYPAYFKEPQGDFPVAGDTAGTISNVKYDAVNKRLTYSMNLSNIINAGKPAGSGIKLHLIEIKLDGGNAGTVTLPQEFRDSPFITGTSYNYNGTFENVDLPDGEYHIHGRVTGTWFVKPTNGALRDAGIFSELGLDPANGQELVVGTPSYLMVANPTVKSSETNGGIKASVTGLSAAPDGLFETNLEAKVGSKVYAKVHIEGNAAEDYNLTALTFGSDLNVNMVIDDPTGAVLPVTIGKGTTRDIIYSFTVPNGRNDVWVNGVTANKMLTLTAGAGFTEADIVEINITGLNTVNDFAQKNTTLKFNPGDEIFINASFEGFSGLEKDYRGLTLLVDGQQVEALPVDNNPFTVNSDVIKDVVYKIAAPANSSEIKVTGYEKPKNMFEHNFKDEGGIGTDVVGFSNISIQGQSQSGEYFGKTFRTTQITGIIDSFEGTTFINNIANYSVKVYDVVNGAETLVSDAVQLKKVLPVTSEGDTGRKVPFTVNLTGANNEYTLLRIAIAKTGSNTGKEVTIRALEKSVGDPAAVSASIVGLSVDPNTQGQSTITYNTLGGEKTMYMTVMVSNNTANYYNPTDIGISCTIPGVQFIRVSPPASEVSFVPIGDPVAYTYEFTAPMENADISLTHINGESMMMVYLDETKAYTGPKNEQAGVSISNVTYTPALISAVDGNNFYKYNGTGDSITVEGTITVTYAASGPGIDEDNLSMRIEQVKYDGNGYTTSAVSNPVDLKQILSAMPAPDAQNNITRTGTFNLTIDRFDAGLDELKFMLTKKDPGTI